MRMSILSLIHNFNSASFSTLIYSNLFLFTTASFDFLNYSFNVIFSATLDIFLFAAACFTPLWYVHNNIWLGGVTFYSTCSASFIHKTAFWGEGLDVPSFFLFLSFFPMFRLSNSSSFCFLNWIFNCIRQRTFVIHI